jgi:hypothetical protein
MQRHDIVDIYGDLVDGSSVIISAGNFNNISGILAYYSGDDLLQIRPLPEIIAPAVPELILTYERPITARSDKIYFSLQVNDFSKSPRYINVNIEAQGNQKIAVACISTEKAIFNIDYSSIDQPNSSGRNYLMAGSLYSLEYTLGEQTYVVSWKIHGFSNGDLIIFLPTTWFEPQNPSTQSVSNQNYNICEKYSGVDLLLERLNQLQFKGFTTQKWCETVPNVSHCQDNNLCGDCMGQCLDPSHICYPDLNGKNLNGKNLNNSPPFVCGPKHLAPNMMETNMVSFSTSDPPPTTGTGATWVAVILIFIIILLLAWGLNTRLKIE